MTDHYAEKIPSNNMYTSQRLHEPLLSYKRGSSRNDLSSRRDTNDPLSSSRRDTDPMSARQISEEELKVQYNTNETIESKNIDINLTPQKSKPKHLKSQLKQFIQVSEKKLKQKQEQQHYGDYLAIPPYKQNSSQRSRESSKESNKII